MPTIAEIEAKWEALRVDATRLGASVSLAAVAADVLSDLARIADPNAEPLATPSEAARARGFHTESIHRMIRAGKITNYGSQRRPLIRLSECPRKARPTASAIENESDCATDIASVSKPDVAHRVSGDALCPTVIALDVHASRRGVRRGKERPSRPQKTSRQSESLNNTQ